MEIYKLNMNMNKIYNIQIKLALETKITYKGTNILSVDLMSGFICRPCTYIEKMLYICLVFTMPHNNQDG